MRAFLGFIERMSLDLSIVTICCNDLLGLQKTIHSLRGQKSHNFEQWIVDGASSDGTKEYLESLEVPWKMHWLSEKDLGIYDAMNKGTEKVSGRFVWYLNSGDQAADSEVIGDLLKKIERHSSVTLIYGKVAFDTPYGYQVSGQELRSVDNFRWGMPVSHPAVLFQRVVLPRHPYRTDFGIISDWILLKGLFEEKVPAVYYDRLFSIFDTTGISSNQFLRDFHEKLRFEKSLKGKISIFFFYGAKMTFHRVVRFFGLYSVFKRWRVHQSKAEKTS